MRRLGALEAVDLRDVRMVERRQRLRFAVEAGEPLGMSATDGSSSLTATSRFRRESRAR